MEWTSHDVAREDGSRATPGLVPRSRALFALALFAFASASCAGQDTRGYPLYAQPARPQVTEVAHLSGYVRYVDGREVWDLGPSFELTPGCHLVETPSEWVENLGPNSQVNVRTGRTMFAIVFKPNHSYLVEVRVERSTTMDGRAELRATESNGQGDVTATFPPANQEMAQRCVDTARAAKD